MRFINLLITTIRMENEIQPKKTLVKAQKKGDAKKTVIQCEDDSSQWSLESLQDLKGINIHQLQEQSNNMESKPKEKQFFQVKFPEKPSVLATAPLHQIGKIIFVVGQLWIMQASSATFVVDLDNWVSDDNRNLLGFVIDVLGKVESPFYAIKPELPFQPTQYLGKTLYYIQGSSKILKDDDIKSMQSKSVMQAVEDNLSSSDGEQQIERDLSGDKAGKTLPWNRKNKFRQQQQDARRSSRDRTRQNRPSNRNYSRPRNEHNQRYLEGMYRMHYNQMMQLQHGFIPPQSQNPFVNRPVHPQSFPHSNVPQFGSNNPPQQFYGQVYQPNLFLGQQPGHFMGQQFQSNPQQGSHNSFNPSLYQGPKFPGNNNNK